MEMDSIMARWRALGSVLESRAHTLQELMAKLMQFEVTTFEPGELWTRRMYC